MQETFQDGPFSRNNLQLDSPTFFMTRGKSTELQECALARYLYLISSTPLCPLCLAVQLGFSEGQQSSRWLPA